MRTVTAGDLEVPVIGYGTWEVTGDDCYRGVRHALDVGYRHIDTAQMYGNEEQVGRAVADSDVDRDEVFLTTKVATDNAAPDDVRRSTAESLRRLDVDHVDLLLIHWPNPDVAVHETLHAMSELQTAQMTRAIGVSNYPSDLLREAFAVAPVVTDQVEYHPRLSQEAVLEVLRAQGGFLTAYSPLAHGSVLDDDVVGEIAEELDVTPAQVALRWLLDQPDVVVLPRSTSQEHIEQNLDLDFALSDEQRERIDALPKDDRQIDPPSAPEWD